MPRLSEIDKLTTSDSSGGRVKSAQKRKYTLLSDSSPARTRGETKQLSIASAALLELGNLNSGNQATSDALPVASPDFPQVGNLDKGNQPEDTASRQPNTQDIKKFVQLPDEWVHNDSECTEDSNLEGNRLIDLEQLQNIVRNNFCCKSCVNKAFKTYLESFFDFTDDRMNEFKSKANKIKTLKDKNKFLTTEIQSTRELYRQFTGYKGKNKESKREAQLSVPIKNNESQDSWFCLRTHLYL